MIQIHAVHSSAFSVRLSPASGPRDWYTVDHERAPVLGLRSTTMRYDTPGSVVLLVFNVNMVTTSVQLPWSTSAESTGAGDCNGLRLNK